MRSRRAVLLKSFCEPTPGQRRNDKSLSVQLDSLSAGVSVLSGGFGGESDGDWAVPDLSAVIVLLARRQLKASLSDALHSSPVHSH